MFTERLAHMGVQNSDTDRGPDRAANPYPHKGKAIRRAPALRPAPH